MIGFIALSAIDFEIFIPFALLFFYSEWPRTDFYRSDEIGFIVYPLPI